MPRGFTRSAAVMVLLLVPAVVLAQPRKPRVGSGENPLELIWKRIMAELEAASVALEPKRTPPKPVKVRWATKRMSSVDLRAPLLAVTLADIDNDKKSAELIAVTTREVVVLKLHVRRYRRGGRVFIRRSWKVSARYTLPTERAAISPRDPVGALVVADVNGDDKLDILARSSRLAKGVVLAWKDGALQELSRFDGFPVCANARARLSTGKNYFLSKRVAWPADMSRPAMPKRFYSARCVGNLVDPDGRRLSAFGRVSTSGTLFVRYQKECGRRDDACKANPNSDLSIRGVGTAWAIADIDNDGIPEVITSGTAAPGMSDRVTVYSGARRLKRRYRKTFVGGVVGLAAGDIDGDGDRDVVAVVRMLGTTTVGLWLLNR